MPFAPPIKPQAAPRNLASRLRRMTSPCTAGGLKPSAATKMSSSSSSAISSTLPSFCSAHHALAAASTSADRPLTSAARPSTSCVGVDAAAAGAGAVAGVGFSTLGRFAGVSSRSMAFLRFSASTCSRVRLPVTTGSSAEEESAAADEEAGLLGFEMHSNGGGREDLCLGYAGADRELASIAKVTNGEYAPIAMNGKEVYKFATGRGPEVLAEALDNAGISADEIDWLLLHQANIRIMETVAKKLGVPMEKVLTNLAEYGNTSAGSIPLALDEAVRSGKVKPGDVVACAGFGAGLSWGAAVLR